MSIWSLGSNLNPDESACDLTIASSFPIVRLCAAPSPHRRLPFSLPLVAPLAVTLEGIGKKGEERGEGVRERRKKVQVTALWVPR